MCSGSEFVADGYYSVKLFALYLHATIELSYGPAFLCDIPKFWSLTRLNKIAGMD